MPVSLTVCGLLGLRVDAEPQFDSDACASQEPEEGEPPGQTSVAYEWPGDAWRQRRDSVEPCDLGFVRCTDSWRAREQLRESRKREPQQRGYRRPENADLHELQPIPRTAKQC